LNLDGAVARPDRRSSDAARLRLRDRCGRFLRGRCGRRRLLGRRAAGCGAGRRGCLRRRRTWGGRAECSLGRKWSRMRL